MRFKVIVFGLVLIFATGCSGKKWFGEEAATPPILKVDYTENDEYTKKCFNLIEAQYDSFVEGRLKSRGFVDAMDCSESLLILGTSRVLGRQSDSYSQDEILLILNSGLLADKEKVQKWVKRIYAVANIIRGSEKERLSKQELRDIFNRLRRADAYFVQLSKLAGGLQKTNVESDKVQDRMDYWHVRRDVFVKLVDVLKILLKDNEEPLVRDVFLKQFEFVSPGFERTQWNKWVDSVFLMNKIIFNRTEDVIRSQDIIPMLDSVSFTFDTIFNAYALNEKTVWDAKDFVEVIYQYQKMIYGFLDRFYTTDGQSIEAAALTRLMELLHVASESEAGTFVTALVDLKNHLFKNEEGENFSRKDIRKLREILKSSLDAHHNSQIEPAVMMADENTRFVKHFWKSPFRTYMSKPSLESLRLSSVMLSLIDQFVSLYDADGDKKIALKTKNKPVAEELGGLVKTAQQLKQGFHKLMGRETALTGVNKETIETVGRVAFSVVEHIFPSSVEDGHLDRYEILEIINFIFENNRVSSQIIAKAMDNKIVSESKSEVLLTIDFLTHKDTQKILDYYFIGMRSGFSTPEAYESYLKDVLDLCKKSDTLYVDNGGVQVFLSFVRVIEHVFMSYDQNADGILSKDEILNFYTHFDTLISEAFIHFEKQSKGTASGYWGSFKTWFGKEIWYGEGEIHKRLFFKMIATGELPKEPIAVPSAVTDQAKQTSSRTEFISLLKKIFEKIATKDAE